MRLFTETMECREAESGHLEYEAGMQARTYSKYVSINHPLTRNWDARVYTVHISSWPLERVAHMQACATVVLLSAASIFSDVVKILLLFV